MAEIPGYSWELNKHSLFKGVLEDVRWSGDEGVGFSFAPTKRIPEQLEAGQRLRGGSGSFLVSGTS